MSREPLDLDDDDDLDLRRRRKQRSARARRRLLTLAGGVVLLAAITVALFVALFKKDRTGGIAIPGATGPGILGPSASSEGEKWNHKDLLNYFGEKGVCRLMEPTQDGSFDGPAAYLIPPARDTKENRVYCKKLGSPTNARDQVGVTVDDSFSWGCFYFRGTNKVFMDSIRRALGAK